LPEAGSMDKYRNQMSMAISNLFTVISIS
jgi:hypothetical protein